MENKNTSINGGSNFATIPGLVILLFFLGLSFYKKTYFIGCFLLMLVILCLIAFLWSRRVLGALHGQAQFLTGGCFPEGELRLSLGVENAGKLWAIWTDVFVPVPRGDMAEVQNAPLNFVELRHVAWSGPAALQKFTWLMPGQKLTCTLEFQAKKRGMFTVDRLYLQTGDGFGIGMKEKAVELDHPAVAAIFPRIYPVHLQAFLLQGNTMDTGKRGDVEDVTLLKNIRPYAYGDSMKRINWRMLAKGQQMQVNVYEQITPEHICFVLDLHSFETKRQAAGEAEGVMELCAKEESLERALSLIASCIIPLGEQNVCCNLMIPGYGGKAPRCTEEKNRQFQTEEMLFMLAGVDYQGGKTVLSEDMVAQLEAAGSRIYIVTDHISEGDMRTGLFSQLHQQVKIICMTGEAAEDVDVIFADDILQEALGGKEVSQA